VSERRVVLTFDYELFFGRSGTPEHCLLRPTDLLLTELAELNAPGCFFVDAAYVLRLLDEPRAAEDARKVADQIRRIVAAGHRVELQMHPHWVDAVWLGEGRWVFPTYRHYQLRTLGRERAIDLVVSATEALASLAGEAVSGYAVQAYRAGGFCAQPFDLIGEAMDAAGLTVDSSVAAGTVARTATHSFDYRHAPKAACWRFETEPLAPEPNGRFAEVPLSSTRVGPLTRLRRRADMLRRPSEYKRFGDGAHMPGYRTLLGKVLPSQTLLALESTSPDVLRSILSRSAEAVTLIGHPKSISPVSLAALRALAEDGARFLHLAELLAECDMAPSASVAATATPEAGRD
jgi:hypothetical protein